MDDADNYPEHSLGWYRVLSVVAFTKDSPAVAFLEAKIAASPRGPLEMVLADESQMLQVLAHIHMTERKSK